MNSALLTFLLTASISSVTIAESSARAQAVPAPRHALADKAGANLAVLAADGVRLSTPARARFDFGEANLLDRPRIEKVFTVRNESGKPLVLDRLKTSCGCTSARLVKQSGAGSEGESLSPGAGLLTLSPGENASLRVTVDLAQILPGAVRVSVFIYGRGQDKPTATATISGVYASSVRFSPRSLDFGTIPAGKPRSLRLTASFDSRLAARGPLPSFVSYNPSVRITPLPEESTATGPTRVRNYTVTVLADAPIGPLNSVAALLPTGTAGMRSAAADPVSRALRSARIVVMGQIIGDVTAQPQSLAFGTVPHGKGSTHRVLLRGVHRDALESLSVFSPHPWLSARLASAREGVPLPTRALEVTLSPAAPAGAFQTQAFIMLANGQRLVLPVSAYVKRGQAK